MADPVTTNKSLVTPPNAADPGAWDVPMNANSNALDRALGGLTVLNAQGASGVIPLTLAQYTPANILVGGTPSGPVNYQLPAGVGGFYFITNATPANAPGVYFSSASVGPSFQVPAQSAVTVVIDPTYGAHRADTPVSPAGASGQLQWNNNGAFGANGNITTDGSNLWVYGELLAEGGLLVGGNIQPTAGYQSAVIPVYAGICTPGVDYGTVSGGTVTVDCRRSNVFKVSLSGNVSLSLANEVDGQTINLFIQQDVNGNHSMSWPGGSSFYLSGGVTTLSTGGYNIDLLVTTYVGAWGVWMGSLVKGFQPM